MAKSKRAEENNSVAETALTEESKTTTKLSGLLQQGLITLAFWMTFGLLLEGFLGYKIPAYLNDDIRRELFRLAHTHGALFSIVLIVIALCTKADFIKPNSYAQNALRIGSVMMPTGFLLGGVWHFESDPGYAIILAPVGGILVIFGIVSSVLSLKKN
jgi:hypothetical protein